MERTILSDEEKIKKAIEISQRRNLRNNTQRIPVREKSKKVNFGIFKRIILQLVICTLIYIIFYLITSTNYIFSQDFIKKANEILNYDINIEQLYSNIKTYIEKLNKEMNFTQNDNNENLISIQNKINTINIVNTEKTGQITNQILNEAIINNESIAKEEKKSQMELDAEEVKKKCKFVIPLNGTITSEFGERETTSKIVSSNHIGIDIAAKEGTKIKSAMNGEVLEATENSEYGKFIKILKDDVMTVYAHCKRIKVSKGDKVKKGDVIATVGSTGNSTGPHLHFEVRLSDRFINPRYVIKF